MSDDLSLATTNNSTLNLSRNSSEPGRTPQPALGNQDRSRASPVADWPDSAPLSHMRSGEPQAPPSPMLTNGHRLGNAADSARSSNSQSPMQAQAWQVPEFAPPPPLPSLPPQGPHAIVPPGAIAQPAYVTSAAARVAADDFHHISHSVRSSAVRVNHLDSMLRGMALSRNGIKKVKIERLLLAAQQYMNAKDYERLHHLRHIVDSFGPNGNAEGAPQAVRPMTYTDAVNNITARPSPPIPATTAPNPLVAPKKNPPVHTPLSFQKSPFYTLETPLAAPMFFMRPYTRRRVQQTSRFRINPNLLRDDGNKVYLVSQQFLPQAQNLRPIYFPFYIDIAVNDQEVKANTRGVRGSVGSAKPVDLTSYLKTKPGNVHTLTVTVHISDQNQYELVSDKSYAMGIYFAAKMPISKLVSQIKDDRSHFTIEQTKQQLSNATADEEGIESTAMRFSLRDTVMRTRIQQPMRSQLCDHIDCFDAESYFMLQDQAETWKCPVCNRRITFESLFFDDFFMDILSNTPENVDAVEISPDGSWSVPSQESDSDSGDSSDDDERPPPIKRARSEPEVEVVDLLSDTDEETPEPVKPVPPRGGFQSGQPPMSAAASTSRQETASPNVGASPREALNGTEAAAGTPRDTPAGEAPAQRSGSSTGGQNGAQAGEQGGAASSGRTGQHGPAGVSQDAVPSANAGPDNEAPNGADEVRASQTPQTAEPRFQIAQMLQSLRGSNSVLFKRTLPYPPSLGLLLGKDSGSAPEPSARESTNEHAATDRPRQDSASVSPSPSTSTSSEHTQLQRGSTPPQLEQDARSASMQPSLSDEDEDVIDLTGDD